MGSERAFAISSRRRGLGRVVVFLSALILALAGCGRSGQGASTDSEKAADVAVLNAALSRELATVDAYRRALPLLRGRALAVVGQYRGQSQAHVDAVTKAIRGVGGEADAAAVEPEAPAPKTRRDALLLAYEAENAALAQALDAVPQMNTGAPRMLAAALAASHAQHVTVLRQLLGGGLASSVPDPFETGDVPPPTPPGEAG
ncbi:MAG TPA: ferritin-like domain-containing protein [Solirubrobacterales bacterium]|nr:ferritin-like domain-containing protein [Solirubrobacterales bacterium]